MRITFITDRRLAPQRPLAEIAAAAVAAGVDRVQLREKDLNGGPLLRLAAELRSICRDGGAELVVNDRLDVALAAGADGVQLPATGLPVAAVRSAVGDRLRIGASTHHLEEARRAEAEGADWVLFGPVFDTPAKRRYGAAQGVEALERVLDRVRIPVWAVGGIDAETVQRLRHLPLAGVAVIRAIMLSEDIEKSVKNW